MNGSSRRRQQDTQQKTQTKRVGPAHLSNSPLRVEELEKRQMLAIFTVTNLNDLVANDDGTSLREAIIAANATVDVPDTIQFDPTLFGAPLPKNIPLTGFLEITDALNIDGPEAASLAISSAASEVFRISPLAGAVTIEGLTLTGINAGNGGAINADNSATLMVANSVITGSAALGNGGGIFATGDLVLSGSTVTGNNANYGGGVYALGDVTAQNSNVIGNTAVGYSGGIYAAGNLLLQNCTVTGNIAGGSGGGAGVLGNATVVNSTVSGNTTTGNGGGLYVTGGNVLVQNSTVSGNDATTGGGIAAFNNVKLQNSTVSGNDALDDGGGIYTNRNLTLQNSTVSGNSANDDVGGVRGNRVTLQNSNVVLNGTTNDFGGVFANILSLRNSIVAGNTTGVGTNPDLGFTSISTFFSLIGDATDTTLTEANPGPDAFGNKIGKATPILPATVFDLTLQNNGGPTFTHALVAGGPAVNAGSNNFAIGFTSDQRGSPFVRISGVKVDMGAFEIQPPPGTPEIDIKGNATSIAIGDTTPSTADHTDFGTALVAAGTISRTFTIQNSGTAALTVSSIVISGAHAGDFTITQNPVSPIIAGGLTTFTVSFDPSDDGTRSATVTVNNNDANEAAYSFAIQGTGSNIAAAPLPFFEDFNDGLAQGMTFDLGNFSFPLNNGSIQLFGQPLAQGIGNRVIATVDASANLLSNLDIRTTVQTTGGDGTLQHSNGIIIFDYKSPTDYKTAGAHDLSNEFAIGHVTAKGFKILKSVKNQPITAGVPIRLQVILTGRTATLFADTGAGFVQKVSLNFPGPAGTPTTFTGKVGIGTINGRTFFDDFSVTQIP